MPIYILRCEKCDHESEVLMGMSDQIPFCSKCGGDLVKVPALGDFQLKGKRDGWSYPAASVSDGVGVRARQREGRPGKKVHR